MRKVYFNLALALFALCLSVISASAQGNDDSVTVTRDTLVVHSAVYYDFNAREFKSSELPKLEKVYDWMLHNSAVVRLVGYADLIGNIDYNQALALDRAEGVKNYLVERGIDASRITSYGDGVDINPQRDLARRVDVFQVDITTNYRSNVRTVEVPVEVIREVPVEVIREVRVVDTLYITKMVKAEPTKFSVGVDLGMPFGVSTLRSRGEDESQPGYSAGVFFRYHMKKALTLDAFVNVGSMKMTNEQCPYYLSTDGNQYYSNISTDDGAYYTDLYSRVRLTEFGVRANFNVFSLFKSLRDSKFALKLSPSIGIGVSNAKVSLLADDRTIYDPSSTCSFALGGDIVAAYNFTPNLELEFYTGLTRYCGGRLDGMPNDVHGNNRTSALGLRFNWRILKQNDNE